MSHRIEQIGDCTLHLGDCREILPLLPKVGALISDPPYGISALLGMGGGSNGDGGMWKGVAIAGDESLEARDMAIERTGAPFAVFAKAATAAPLGTKATVAWDKGGHTGAGDLSMPWKPSFELVYIGGNGWAWETRIGGVVRVNAVSGCVGAANDGVRSHPFEKPVAIMRHFCERAPSGTILDPFMGSGTTGVACVKLGRKFIGIEIDETYFDIACKRIRDAYAQPDLFVAAPAPKAEQLSMLAAE